MGSSSRSNVSTPPPSVAELASASGIRECLQWFSREKQWITEQHLTLCRIPAPTFLEGKRAEWMVAQFQSAGWEARIDRGGNVVVQHPSASGGPFVAITAHLDTVLAPRKPEEIRLEPDGTLRGPGVADNGAGLTALLALAKTLALFLRPADGLDRVIFVANVGEEGEGNLSGIRYLCRQSPLAQQIRSFIVLDGPSTEHITSRALASRRFEVSFTGAGGHSWSDFGAGNPVHALSRSITLFTDARHEAAQNGARTSFNFGTIDGGSSITSIPTEARAKVDIRSEAAASIDAMAALLANCVERAMQMENERATSRVSAKIREIGSRPGGGVPEDAPILRYVRAVDAHLGIRSHLDCASTDANIPLSMGLPAISIGAGGFGGGAHTPAEWYHPSGREQGLSRVVLLLQALLRDAAG